MQIRKHENNIVNMRRLNPLSRFVAIFFTKNENQHLIENNSTEMLWFTRHHFPARITGRCSSQTVQHEPLLGNDEDELSSMND